MKNNRAFTLLEVMVAVAILAISLVSLFTLQTQSIGITSYVTASGIAAQLARCRMSEIELEILKEGFEIAEFEDWQEGACCELRDNQVELAGNDPFSCRWHLLFNLLVLESSPIPFPRDVVTWA